MKKATFEENMTRLEEIVELDTARQKVVKLTKGPDGAPVEEDFTSEEDYI